MVSTFLCHKASSIISSPPLNPPKLYLHPSHCTRYAFQTSESYHCQMKTSSALVSYVFFHSSSFPYRKFIYHEFLVLVTSREFPSIFFHICQAKNRTVVLSERCDLLELPKSLVMRWIPDVNLVSKDFLSHWTSKASVKIMLSIVRVLTYL